MAQSAAPVAQFSKDEVAAMASVLRRRHGAAAPGIAGHFALEHKLYQDETRAEVWRRVQALLTSGNQSRTEC